MKLELILIGKTQTKYLIEGEQEYAKRLKHYVDFKVTVLDSIKKKTTVELLKQQEADKIMKKIKNEDFVVLLDEAGVNLDSIKYSEFLQNKMNTGVKKIVFVIGGAFGFSKEMYERADYQLSLSKMTFTHDMVRLFFQEQLYRAFTIINNEKYHH